MIVTEEEAKTKWCRHARVSVGYGPYENATTGFAVFNRASEKHKVPENSLCIGSGCMAWEWVGGWSRDDHTGLNGPITPAKGYCGAK